MPNTSIPARDIQYGVVQVLRAPLTFLNTTAKVIGVLPPGSIVVGGGINVSTLFNDSGTDLVDIGTSGDADEFGSALDVSAVGFKALDELATHDGYSATAEVTVTATYTGANANSTAGAGEVVIMYVTKPGVF